MNRKLITLIAFNVLCGGFFTVLCVYAFQDTRTALDVFFGVFFGIIAAALFWLAYAVIVLAQAGGDDRGE